MFMPRRRPLMRAAMLGGAGYMAGKHAQQGAYREQSREERLAELEEQPVAAPPAPAGEDLVGQLTELKGLLDAGALTPDEFEAAKRKVLGG